MVSFQKEQQAKAIVGEPVAGFGQGQRISIGGDGVARRALVAEDDGKQIVPAPVRVFRQCPAVGGLRWAEHVLGVVEHAEAA